MSLPCPKIMNSQDSTEDPSIPVENNSTTGFLVNVEFLARVHTAFSFLWSQCYLPSDQIFELIYPNLVLAFFCSQSKKENSTLIFFVFGLTMILGRLIVIQLWTPAVFAKEKPLTLAFPLSFSFISICLLAELSAYLLKPTVIIHTDCKRHARRKGCKATYL